MTCATTWTTLLALCAAGSAIAAPLGTAFTYQGQLKENAQPATGQYDLQFCLFDSPSSPIPLSCAADQDNVAVDAGVFAVTLDFGSSSFDGEARHLELRVRPGASAAGYTILGPRQIVRPAPEALRANVASAAPWSGLTGVPAGLADGIDADSATNVIAGAGLITGDGDAVITDGDTVFISEGGVSGAMIAPQAVGAAQINPGEVQVTITPIVCPPGTAIVGIGGSSTICGDPGGVESVVGGGGVTATGTGTVTLGSDATVQRRTATPSCPAGQALTALAQDGTPTCATFSRVAVGSSNALPPTAGGAAIGAQTSIASTGRTLFFSANIEMGSTTGASDLQLYICGTGVNAAGATVSVALGGAQGLTAAAGQRHLFSFSFPFDGAALQSVNVSICGQSNLGSSWNNNGNARLTILAL